MKTFFKYLHFVKMASKRQNDDIGSKTDSEHGAKKQKVKDVVALCQLCDSAPAQKFCNTCSTLTSCFNCLMKVAHLKQPLICVKEPTALNKTFGFEPDHKFTCPWCTTSKPTVITFQNLGLESVTCSWCSKLVGLNEEAVSSHSNECAKYPCRFCPWTGLLNSPKRELHDVMHSRHREIHVMLRCAINFYLGFVAREGLLFPENRILNPLLVCHNFNVLLISMMTICNGDQTALPFSVKTSSEDPQVVDELFHLAKTDMQRLFPGFDWQLNPTPNASSNWMNEVAASPGVNPTVLGKRVNFALHSTLPRQPDVQEQKNTCFRCRFKAVDAEQLKDHCRLHKYDDVIAKLTASVLFVLIDDDHLNANNVPVGERLSNHLTLLMFILAVIGNPNQPPVIGTNVFIQPLFETSYNVMFLRNKYRQLTGQHTVPMPELTPDQQASLVHGLFLRQF